MVFNAEPVKVKPDYAKFLLDNPGLNFTFNLKEEVSGNQVGHFCFQVENQEEVLQHKDRTVNSFLSILCMYLTETS
jgi:hypothetical protein